MKKLSLKKSLLLLALGMLVLSSYGGTKKMVKMEETPVKPALMWFDAEANFGRFNQKDSIDYYLQKIKSLGFTHAIVDVRPITGEVLYDSKYAPRMEEWKGAKRGNFDYLDYFIQKRPVPLPLPQARISSTVSVVTVAVIPLRL